MAHGHRAEVLSHFAGVDTDTWVVRTEWVHGIYGTHEREVVVVWQGIEESWVILPDGSTFELKDQSEPMYEAVRAAIKRLTCT